MGQQKSTKLDIPIEMARFMLFAHGKAAVQRQNLHVHFSSE